MVINTRSQLLFEGDTYIVKNTEPIFIPVNHSAVVESEGSFDIVQSKFRVIKKIDKDNPSSTINVSEFPKDTYPLLGDFSTTARPSKDPADLPYMDEETDEYKYKTPHYGFAGRDDICYYADEMHYTIKGPGQEDPSIGSVEYVTYRLYEWDTQGWLQIRADKFNITAGDTPILPSDPNAEPYPSILFGLCWANIDKSDHGHTTLPQTDVVMPVFRGLDIRSWTYDEARENVIVDFFNPQTCVMNKGDTVSSIAYRYSVKVEDLMQENGLYEYTYSNVGSVLVLPRKNVTIPANTEIKVYAARHVEDDPVTDEIEHNTFVLHKFWNIVNDLNYQEQTIVHRPASKTYSDIVKRPNDIWKTDTCDIKYAVANVATSKISNFSMEDDIFQVVDTYPYQIVDDKHIGDHYYIRKVYTESEIDTKKLEAYSKYLTEVEMKKAKKVDTQKELEKYVKKLTKAQKAAINFYVTPKQIPGKLVHKYVNVLDKNSASEGVVAAQYVQIAVQVAALIVKGQIEQLKKDLQRSTSQHSITVSRKSSIPGATVKVSETFVLVKSNYVIYLWEWDGGSWIQKVFIRGQKNVTIDDTISKKMNKCYKDIWYETDGSGKSIWKSSMQDLPPWISPT